MQRSHLDLMMIQGLRQYPTVSDFILSPGKPMQGYVDGRLQDVALDPDPGPLTPFQTEAAVLAMLDGSPRLHADLARFGSCDMAYDVVGVARFRVNVFKRFGSLAVVMRRLPSRVPDLEELGLPSIVEDMCKEPIGLILVTGGTGSGKSTTLASMIRRIAQTRADHIITLEDPVEFVHQHALGLVEQRELGSDFMSFTSGLRAALRQAPKIILVGEIRDKDTLDIALQASETGHLVMGSLHTGDAGQTVTRMLGLFDHNEEQLVRSRLADSLKWVLSQKLVPAADKGRVLATEVLRTSLRVRDLIRKGEHGDNTFYNVLNMAGPYGMHTFDASLEALLRAGGIAPQTAQRHASDRASMTRMIDALKREQGEGVDEIRSLSIDHEYGVRG